MRNALFLAAAATALGLAGCEPAAEAPGNDVSADQTTAPAAADEGADTAAAAEYVLSADGEGLRLVNTETGSTNLLPFGAPREQSLTALNGAGAGLGEPGTNAECPSGAIDFVDYADGPTVLFQDGAFVGWTSDDATLSTMNGIAVGSTRADLEDSGSEIEFTETSLGEEFDAGGVYGIMNEDGSAVQVLWAGANCFAR